MGKPSLNLGENSIKAKEFKEYPQKPNGISCWAFLLSIFIYISIFHILNLSPPNSTLFNNTKFWFFISNTLILIIAANSGAFSSSKEKHDFYEENLVNSTRARNVPSFDSQYWEIVAKSIPQQEVEKSQKKKEVVCKREFPENKLEIVVKSDPEKASDDFQQKPPEFATNDNIKAHEKKKIEAKCLRRKSDKANPVANNENKIILHRSETEKRESSIEENEFSTMSDEELNRRVEEFIQKFNRQIRLQRLQNFHQI